MESVPFQAAVQAGGFGAIDENAQVDQDSNGGPAEQPEAVDEQELAGSVGGRKACACMRFEIVVGHLEGVPLTAAPEYFLEGRPVDGAGMIEVDPASSARAEVGLIPVKVVQTDAGGRLAQSFLELTGQPALAGAAAADDCHQPGSGLHGPRLPQRPCDTPTGCAD